MMGNLLFEHVRDGMVLAGRRVKNQTFIEGLEKMVETVFRVDGSLAFLGPTPEFGIIDSTGFTTGFDVADTIDSHSGWVEYPAGTGTYETQSKVIPSPPFDEFLPRRCPWWYDAADHGWVPTTREKLESFQTFISVSRVAVQCIFEFRQSRDLKGVFLQGPGVTSQFGFGKYLLAGALFDFSVVTNDQLLLTYELNATRA